jgi:DNA-binding NarL/FixJ family response regulator
VVFQNRFINAIKAGVSGYVHKTEKLETLGLSIISKSRKDNHERNREEKSSPDCKTKQSERLYRKLSNREVVRYLSGGKRITRLLKF